MPRRPKGSPPSYRLHNLCEKGQPMPARPDIDPLTQYIRKARGKYQARVPLDRCCRRLNLGLYDSLHEARKAIKHWVATGKRSPGVLPKYVRGSRGGRFVAAIPTPGAKARLGPFETADEASRAAEEHIRRMLAERTARYLEGRA